MPDAIGAVAIFNNPVAANRVVLLGEDITIGSLTFNNSSGFTNTISGNNETSVLTFDAVGAGPATIEATNMNDEYFSGPGIVHRRSRARYDHSADWRLGPARDVAPQKRGLLR